LAEAVISKGIILSAAEGISQQRIFHLKTYSHKKDLQT